MKSAQERIPVLTRAQRKVLADIELFQDNYGRTRLSLNQMAETSGVPRSTIAPGDSNVGFAQGGRIMTTSPYPLDQIAVGQLARALESELAASPVAAFKRAESLHAIARYDRERRLAGFYGLFLPNQGYSPEQAAQMVMQRYPSTRTKLESIGGRRPFDPPQREEELLRRVPCLCGITVRSHERETICEKCKAILIVERHGDKGKATEQPKREATAQPIKR